MQDIKNILLEVVDEAADQGPGFAQESVVLRRASEKLRIAPGDVDRQQALLTCWHDLFRDGELSWGYDIDNPSAPSFHKPQRAAVHR